MPAGDIRRAGESDAGPVADLLALAFYDDPTWSWAFPDPESSNRANDRRYERLGFELIGEFAAPGGEPTVGCMWREPGGEGRTDGLSRPGRA